MAKGARPFLEEFNGSFDCIHSQQLGNGTIALSYKPTPLLPGND
ncbi:hypothetical protein [Paraflavitalea pollutisoli]|nr:hypothetical protein [Paraflavitalea sp. H1-2-19X]